MLSSKRRDFSPSFAGAAWRRYDGASSLESKQMAPRRAAQARRPSHASRLPSAPRAAGGVPRLRFRRRRDFSRPRRDAAPDRRQPGRDAGPARAGGRPRPLDHGRRDRRARVAPPARAAPRRRSPHQRPVADQHRAHASSRGSGSASRPTSAALPRTSPPRSARSCSLCWKSWPAERKRAPKRPFPLRYCAGYMR